MPENQSSRLCAVCGEPVNGDCYQRVQYRHKACHNKTQEEKRKAAMYASRVGRTCARCGGDIPAEKNAKTKYCSDKCRDAARGDRSRYYKEYRERNKQSLRDKANEYMSTRRALDPEFRKRQTEAVQRYKRNNPESVVKHRRNETRAKSRKHDGHVKLWRKIGLDWRVPLKHCAHVSTWKNHLRANPSASARYFKSIGQPWRNPHLTPAAKFRVQYKLDPAFKFYHVNKAGWRSDELAARNDGTINFLELMRERKTCPYCGTKITKENAVADHMDPMKHGGANGQHNLTICCQSCNTRKSGRPFVEWIDMLPEDRRNAALLWYKRKHGHSPEQSSLCFEFKAA